MYESQSSCEVRKAMSDIIPRFRYGDRVRIIQTSEMEYHGIANKRGTVMCTPLTPSHLVKVYLDEECVVVPVSTLMKEPQHPTQGERTLEHIPTVAELQAKCERLGAELEAERRMRIEEESLHARTEVLQAEAIERLTAELAEAREQIAGLECCAWDFSPSALTERKEGK
jgi:hypothetical protein